MTRTTVEKLHVTYSRTVTETTDDEDDPRPSFPAPAAKVVDTDAEVISERTVPLAKCVALRTLRKVG